MCSPSFVPQPAEFQSPGPSVQLNAREKTQKAVSKCFVSIDSALLAASTIRLTGFFAADSQRITSNSRCWLL